VALRVLLGEAGEKRVRIGLAKDGSGVGGSLFSCSPSSRLASWANHRPRHADTDATAALSALQAKKALDKRPGASTPSTASTGKVEATGQTGSKPVAA
jgi:hexokinase